MEPYDHKKIEAKWQKRWEKDSAFKAFDASKKKKWYSLIEFPYPSGDGLHVGHIRSNTAIDIISRKRRREGFNVLYPIGWDAFGLPTENYAIKTGKDPHLVTEENTSIFRRQLKSLGFSFDWSREINTTDPKYYRWTQWIFLQFLKAGLAYKKKMAINWCPKDLIGLANEEVVDGKCERCGTPVEKREKEQWMLAITKYADRLDKDLDTVDYLPEIKAQQRNWIGRSEGALIKFEIKDDKKHKYVLLHGFTGKPTDPLYPWLKKELESRGHTAIIPELPDTDNPSEKDQVGAALKATDYDENTILYGHSLGSVVALKVLEKLNKKIKGLVLAGAFVDPKFKDHKRNFENRFTWTFDVDKIKKNCGSITVLHDINDVAISDNQANRVEQMLGVSVQKVIAKEPHFDADQEPLILQALLPSIEVFTTRPDTLFGVTYVVLAPEHELVRELLPLIKNRSEALVYITKTKKESDIERTDATREKTGVELKGVKAVNPANGEEVPVYIADYVLADYGTGAVMAVPAHDDRDFAFAKKYGLPIRDVVMPCVVDHVNPPRPDKPSKMRRNAHAIVYDPKQKKYLAIKNDKHGWNTVVMGGVEDGESSVDTVKREIMEETGYTDVEFKRILGAPVRAEYFAKHKDENRVAVTEAVYLELKGDAKVPVTDDNGEGNVTIWVDEKDFIPGFMVNSELPYWLARLHSKDGVAYTGDGLLVNSGSFNDKKSQEIQKEITAFAGGQWISKYKLRDWVFSRQRYWGEPIPVVHCDKCGIVPVPEKDLPVELPPVKDYKPTETGESPLAAISDWVNVKCPRCGGPAKRETDTMPNWAGSSWYYLRYTDPKNHKGFADMKKLKYWTPVDWYNGGMEHVTLHLLYSRFWHKFLFDQKLVPTSEPYKKRTAHGLVLAKGGDKMSKSRGNVINPDGIIENVGADSLRLYEMFMGPFDQAITWDENGIVGCRRFLERVWRLRDKVTSEEKRNSRLETRGLKLLPLIHKTIKKVSEDIEDMRFNTAVSALMILSNEMEKERSVEQESYETLLRLLAPFAPHMTEELWSAEGGLGRKESIHVEPWPVFDPALLVESKVRIAVQINGKTRAEMEVDTDIPDELVKKAAMELEQVKKWLNGNTPTKTILVKGRLVNFVLDM